MIKKILLILLVPSLFLTAFLGYNHFKDEDDVDKIMEYIDCDNVYVGTYAGWIEIEYSSKLLRGYENAKKIVKSDPLPAQR